MLLRSAEAHHCHTWTFPQQSNCPQDVRRRRDGRVAACGGTALLTGVPSLLKASTHSLCLSSTTSSLTLSEDSSRRDAATGNQVCVWVLVPQACPRTFVHHIYGEELGPPRLSFLLKPHGFTVDLFTVGPCWSVPRTSHKILPHSQLFQEYYSCLLNWVISSLKGHHMARKMRLTMGS